MLAPTAMLVELSVGEKLVNNGGVVSAAAAVVKLKKVLSVKPE